MTTTTTRQANWRAGAACIDVDAELFFPVAETGPVYDAQVARAKAVCAGCPVRRDCLAEALTRIPYGIAGGLTERERAELRRRPEAPPTTGEGPRVAATARRSGRAPSVNASLTGGRRGRVVENAEFTAFGRRVVRAAGRRVAAGDVDALPNLLALACEVDAAIGDAVAGLRTTGYSWAEIAARLGITRQAAQQRWRTADDGSTRQGVAS